jgi:hypothetical protein
MGADFPVPSDEDLHLATRYALAAMTWKLNEASSDPRAIYTPQGTAVREMLDELVRRPYGEHLVTVGFANLVSALLSLIEQDTGSAPDATLERLGRLLA